MIVHAGTSMNCGHFYAYVRCGLKWFKVDDMKVCLYNYSNTPVFFTVFSCKKTCKTFIVIYIIFFFKISLSVNWNHVDRIWLWTSLLQIFYLCRVNSSRGRMYRRMKHTWSSMTDYLNHIVHKMMNIGKVSVSNVKYAECWISKGKEHHWYWM